MPLSRARSLESEEPWPSERNARLVTLTRLVVPNLFVCIVAAAPAASQIPPDRSPVSLQTAARAIAALPAWQVSLLAESPGWSQSRRSTISFRTPNLIRVDVSAGEKSAAATGDGSSLAAVYRDGGGARFLKRPSPPGREAVTAALRMLDHDLPAGGADGAGSGLGPFASILAGEDPLASGPRSVVPGTVTRDSAAWLIVPSRGPSRPVDVTLQVDPATGIPLRISYTPQARGYAPVEITFSNWRDLPEVDEDFFAVVPPAAAKEVKPARPAPARPLPLLGGLIVVAAALWALARKIDVRLTLTLAGLALGLLAGDPGAVVRKFFSTFADERYIIPIGSAMGFAYVLRHTFCDQHLVHLLTNPLRRVLPLLVPGAVLVGYLVNIPVISQTSTAVAIGPVLIPLLLAGGVSPVTAGAALLMGASVGGELWNPGAPEYRTVLEKSAELGRWSGDWSVVPMPVDATAMVRQTAMLNLLQLAVSLAIFWWLCLRAESRRSAEREEAARERDGPEAAPEFRVNLFKALVPIAPLAILFLVGGAVPKPTQVVELPQDWLVDARSKLDQISPDSTFDARLIGVSMLVGVVLAALTDLKRAAGVMRSFFDGAGFALAEVIAIIVAANCFGEGIRLIGLAQVIGGAVEQAPLLLIPLAALIPLLMGFVSGSGMASTQGLYEFFARPAWAAGIDPLLVGSVVSLAAAAGRTMSPVAAVTLMSARLTETAVPDLLRRVTLPLIAGAAAMTLLALVLSR